jgi:hypothetical protein
MEVVWGQINYFRAGIKKNEQLFQSRLGGRSKPPQVKTVPEGIIK